MIRSLEIGLAAQCDTNPRPIPPTRIQGWFYDVIEAVLGNGVSDYVHQTQTKPFCLWTLPPHKRQSVLRVTLIGDSLANGVGRALALLEPNDVILEGSPQWNVTGVDWVSQPQRTIGGLDWADLVKGNSPTQFEWSFITPLHIKRSQKGTKPIDWPFPEPKLVFGNLARRFKALAPADISGLIPREFTKWVETGIEVTKFFGGVGQGKTSKGGSRRGFLGEVSYRIRQPGSPNGIAAGMLGMWAPWVGVGGRTTQGFGWIQTAK